MFQMLMTFKYMNNSLVGLKNYGNSCYMNVILQLLSRVFELRNILNPDNFACELWEMHAHLKSVCCDF
jgi:ubiquitin C-terminal hydrolase